MKRLIKGIISAVLAVSILVGTAFAQTSSDSSPATEENKVIPTPQRAESMIHLQNGMRAVFVTPETDFPIEGADFGELYNTVRGFGMNAVILNSVNGGKIYYDIEQSGEDTLEKAIEAAHNAGLSAYITLDANLLLKSVSEQGGGLKEGFSAAAHKFVMKYACEGILLTDYYTADTPEMHAEYLRSGSGIGYENWLYETNRYIIRTLCEVVHKTNNTTAVGILVENAWANSDSNEAGSETSDSVQALYDGYCDTKKYIEDKLADFVMVKAYGSTESSELNFDKVVSWWYNLAQKSGIKAYVCHLNERIGEYSGWNEDQLLQQLIIMENMKNLGGSAFNSLSSLKANPLNSTETLKQYFDDLINKQSVFEGLEMITPTSQNFSTYDSTVKFMGTFDENFDVLFDGEKIELNEKGNFFIQKDLNVGYNSFTIEHKGKKYEYSIERNIKVLKSIEQISDITVEGGTRISLEAIAYSGSAVSATIGGVTVQLNERGSSDKIDANSSYSEFVGYYTVPQGIVGEEQYLGNISYYAYYQGYDGYASTGSVTIAAKPEPVKPDIGVNIKDQSSAGTGEVVGTIDPIRTEDEWVTYVRVTNNFTDVLDPKTTGDVPSPDFSQLPAGTLDYYKSSFSTEDYNYIITASGKRIRASYVTTFEDTGLGYNALEVKSIGNSGGKSYIRFGLDYRISFNVTTSVNFVQGFEGPYGVNRFDAKYVYITFDNVTSVTKLPDFSSCSLFSAGEWETVTEDGIPKFRLKLTLEDAGIYSGVSAYYDDNRDLTLTFNIPTNGIAGKTIVIDPGHGYDEYGTFDVGAVGEVTEQSITIEVAKKLEQQLSAMGANVIRLPTEQYGSNLHDRDRPREANKYNADMFLSLHCNSVENPSPHGCEVYYFTPWSKTLAKNINDNLAAYYDGIYADGTNSSRGDKYSYYWYTLEQSFPSVLVEMGFVSNQRECLLMADSDRQDGMARAIAQGIVEYFERA